MNLTQITDLNTPSLQIYKILRDNVFSKDNSFIADSPKVVNILLETDIEVRSILATQEYYDKFRDLIENKNIPILYVGEKKLIETIIGHKLHHNVMLHGVRPKESSLDEMDDKIIILDNIGSSENVGAIARSAAGLGVYSYLLPKNSPHPYGRRALRVSMGHISKLKYRLYDDILETIGDLKKSGYQIFGAELEPDSVSLADIQVPRKWALIMGNEDQGLSKKVIKACDKTVKIDMAEGVKSLNVAIAASILIHGFAANV